ncbi:MAG: biliverdin-producing heme oxygenase, partial [Polaromonas sp.]|nr:biliverdin-producing heme oxygenase [Polaromonas sp.]
VAPHALAETPQCQALPDLATPLKLFGCLYVLEGATLGGQIITRHLHASLGLTPQSGGSFFSGYGPHTGSRWKEFCAHLTAFAAQLDSDAEIVDSANATFDSLDRWLYPKTTTTIKPIPYEPAEHA